MSFLNVGWNAICSVIQFGINARCSNQTTIKTFFKHCHAVGRIALTKLSQNQNDTVKLLRTISPMPEKIIAHH